MSKRRDWASMKGEAIVRKWAKDNQIEDGSLPHLVNQIVRALRRWNKRGYASGFNVGWNKVCAEWAKKSREDMERREYEKRR